MKRVIRGISKPKPKALHPARKECGTCEHWLDMQNGKPRERTVCMGPGSPFYTKDTKADCTCDKWKEDFRFQVAQMEHKHEETLKYIEKKYGIVIDRKKA